MDFFYTHVDLFQEKIIFLLDETFCISLTGKKDIRITKAENMKTSVKYLGLRITILIQKCMNDIGF